MAQLESWQEALLKHVAPIPVSPEFMPSGVKDDKTKGNAQFGMLAGMTHAALFADWDAGKPTTTCNSFLSSCAVAMGYTGGMPVSSFDIAEVLATRGLSHCWVLPDSGAEPECGDIFRLLGSGVDHNKVRKNHMGIILEVKDGNWFTAEGGQGGKSSGQDKLMRKQYTGRPDDLRGWASMRAMMHANKGLPYWLGGWWKVEEEPYDTWYYHFGAGGAVAGTYIEPTNPLMPPVGAKFSGHFREKGFGLVEISWNDESVDEEIQIAVDTDRKRHKDVLGGKTRKGAKLKGVRLWNEYK